MRSFSMPLCERSFRRVHAGALLLFLSLPVGMARASPLQHGSQLRRSIEHLEAQYSQAMLKDNVGAMRRLLADDYLGIAPNGMIRTKAETLSAWKKHVIVIERLELSDLHVRIYGDTAVVTSRARVIGHGPDGVANGDYRYTRVYHCDTSGRWRIVSFEANRIRHRHRHRGM